MNLCNLTAAAYHLLECAAAHPFDVFLDTLSILVEAGADGFEAGISELQSKQIVVLAQERCLLFAHLSYRDAVYENTEASSRRAIHRRWAETLESASDPPSLDRFAVLAWHWEHAADGQRARPCYLAAARAARKVYAQRDAERFYRAYLDLVEVPTAESIQARNELAREVLGFGGRLEDQVTEHSRALDEALRIGDELNAGRSHALLSLPLLRLGKRDQALASVEASLAIARSVRDRPTEAAALLGLARLFSDEGRLREAQGTAAESLAIARAIGDRQA
ncbi:MAG: tetratricopeptide repeat protein [Candidatus Schekmanbacteria bacterium]|nr:tetratricopeptide repeat protein [Candidatus Schekmanbacteria bacterium]